MREATINKKNDLVIFIIITFGLSLLLSAFIAFTGGHASKFINAGYASMFIPAIAVLCMIYIFKSPVIIHHKKFSLASLMLAIFLMPVVIHSICLSVLYLSNNNLLPWQSWLRSKNGLYNTSGDHAWGTLTLPGLILRIFFNAITGLIVVSILAYFEEVGWRAWMLPRLIEKFNVKKGVLIDSLIWALWHIPFMLSGILYIKGVSVNAIVLLNPVGILGAGIVISWLWIKTKNTWIVSIAHGALNNWGQYAFKYMQDIDPPIQTLLLIALNGSLFLLGIIFLVSIKNRDSSFLPLTKTSE